ncbi:HSP20-like chaperone, partial [Sporodiniella umbellata]
MPLHPTVLWAQRNDLLILTVEVSDIKEHTVDLKEDRIIFKGKGEKEQNEYEAEIVFHAPVKVEDAKKNLTARNLTMVINKQSQGFWPRLQKGNKLNFLKVDFQRWKDEDDEEEEGAGDNGMGGMGGMDFSSLMSQAGGDGFKLPQTPGDDSSDDEEEEQEEKK